MGKHGESVVVFGLEEINELLHGWLVVDRDTVPYGELFIAILTICE